MLTIITHIFVAITVLFFAALGLTALLSFLVLHCLV